VLSKCRRDGVEEDYLNPRDVRVKLTARLPANFGSGTCTWTIGTGTSGRTIANQDCAVTVYERVPTRQATAVSVVAQNQAGATLQGTTTIETVTFSSSGLAIQQHPRRQPDRAGRAQRHRLLLPARSGTDRSRFFLPGRAKANVVADCPLPGDVGDQRDAWEAANARWLFAPCHLSLYSYQARAALALAIENPTLSVTYIPWPARARPSETACLAASCARAAQAWGPPFPARVSGQIEQLSSYLQGGGNSRRPI
jgi:hypothetical protein